MHLVLLVPVLDYIDKLNNWKAYASDVVIEIDFDLSQT